MGSRTKTIETLRRHIRASEESALKARMKQAGLEEDEEDVRVAGSAHKQGEDQGVAPQSKTMRRNIPKDYDYDPRAMKPLAQMLWALSICLGHAMTAHREFVKLKSATISPDGLLGGRGYVMSIKDIRKTLHDACEAISAVSDTIHDELHGPHWRSHLAELESGDIESVERLVGDAERVLENPEEESFVEDGIDKAEQEGEQAELEEHEVGDPESDERFQKQKPPPEFLNQDGEGSDEEDEDAGDDDEEEDEDQEDPNAEIPDGEDLADTQAPKVKTASCAASRVAARFDRCAESLTPGRYTDSRPTDAWDFGLGFGDGDDAEGKGVDDEGWGEPSSQLPTETEGPKPDGGSGSAAVEALMGRSAHAVLPNDGEPGVARSDYYPGDKGASQQWGDSALPSGVEGLEEYDWETTPGVSYKVERPQAYVEWDDVTRNNGPDALHRREGFRHAKQGKVK